jgi:hypothetical protein
MFATACAGGCSDECARSDIGGVASPQRTMPYVFFWYPMHQPLALTDLPGYSWHGPN